MSVRLELHVTFGPIAFYLFFRNKKLCKALMHFAAEKFILS